MPGTASANGGIAELILSAGPVAKFVLLLLAVFSIICWALIVEKWWEFRKIRRDTTSFVRIFREARRFSVVYAAAKKHRDSPLAQLYLAAGQEVATALGGAETIDRVLEEEDEGVGPERAGRASTARCDARRTVEVARMERYLPFLATTASSAPFIGLFGTVWGIMSVVPGHRRAGLGQPRRGRARHLRGAHRDGGRARRGHSRRHGLQLLREPRQALGGRRWTASRSSCSTLARDARLPEARRAVA